MQAFKATAWLAILNFVSLITFVLAMQVIKATAWLAILEYPRKCCFLLDLACFPAWNSPIGMCNLCAEPAM